MPFLIAKENRYFEMEGLNVNVLVARGNLCTMALIANSITFTASPSTFDSLVAGDLRGKVTYVLGKFLLHRLVVQPEIKNFSDLKGAKIAISSFGSLTDQLTREILAQHGLKAMKDVILLQTGGAPVRYAALKSKNVQAALLSTNYGLAALNEGFHELQFEPPPYTSSPIIVKDETLARETAMVRGFLRAVLKGQLFFGQRPEQTIALMQKLLRMPDVKLAKEDYEDEMTRYNPGGKFAEEARRRVIQRARESRNVARPVAEKEIFDFSVAAQVEEELKRQGWKP
jgi:NitT/TauT family transport system substrate-binding protein